jgi:hypothetical protein
MVSTPASHSKCPDLMSVAYPGMQKECLFLFPLFPPRKYQTSSINYVTILHSASFPPIVILFIDTIQHMQLPKIIK